MADVAEILNMARAGHRDAAVLGLTGRGQVAVDDLAPAFRAEADPVVRDVLVEAAWKLRTPGVHGLLAEALDDPDPRVWRQALDGLTSLASEESLRVLEAARDRRGPTDDDFSTWIDQAIEDAEGRINE